MRSTPATLATILLAAAAVSICEGATVTNLQVIAQKGQAFVTFREIAGTNVTYSVYRSNQPITNVSGLTPVATLPQRSARNKYTNTNFIVTDLGSPLADGFGLLVWTPSQNGSYYYAVTNSTDPNIIVGTNALASPVAETVVAVPGSVQLKPTYNKNGPGTNLVTEFFAWEDYATWDHANWPYYGHRYDVVTQPVISPGVSYPLTLVTHGFDGSGYREPIHHHVFDPATGIFVVPRDNNFASVAEPYTGQTINNTFWYGYKRADGIVVNNTERRVIRYVTLTRDDVRYQVDPTRLYVIGASLGGGGSMHIAYHYPTFFASAAPSIGWTDPTSNFLAINFAPYFGSNTESGIPWNNWNDQTWLVNNRSPLGPPIIHTFRKDDGTLNMSAYPNLLSQTEAKKNAHISRWQNGGHLNFFLSGNADYLRFKSNEAYPAFASASNSDPVVNQEGQRNLKLDWSSALHGLGTGTDIVDTSNTFTMSFRSLTVDATAQVTFRNCQGFSPAPGEVVTWSNRTQAGETMIESGTTVADSNGLVTVTTQIRAAGNRLTLTRSGGQTPPPAAPTNLRITG